MIIDGISGEYEGKRLARIGIRMDGGGYERVLILVQRIDKTACGVAKVLATADQSRYHLYDCRK
jgi:hypothetical protein